MFELMESYVSSNLEGQEFGADVQEPSSTSLVIVCPRGSHPKQQFTSLIITVRATVATGKRFAIECEIEQWGKRAAASASPVHDWTKKMSFVLHSDHISLLYQDEKLTPFQAAERLLGAALLKGGAKSA